MTSRRLPFYFFLTIFTIVIAWWVEIYHFTAQAKENFLSRASWVLLAINLVLYRRNVFSLFLAPCIILDTFSCWRS